MNRSLLNQIERVVLLFVLYALTGIAGSAVAYRLLQLGRAGQDYGPLVIAIGLLVALVGCIVLVRGRDNPPLFPLPPWVPGAGTTLLALGLLPVIVALFRPQVLGTGAATAPAAPVARDTIVSVLPAPAVATVRSDTAGPALPVALPVTASEPPAARVPAAASLMVPRSRRSFSAYGGEDYASTPPALSRYTEPAAASDVAWAERLRRRVLRENYAPSQLEMGRYRRVRDSLQRTTGNLSLGTSGMPAATTPAAAPRFDPFEEVPTDVPAGAPVRGSFDRSPEDSTTP